MRTPLSTARLTALAGTLLVCSGTAWGEEADLIDSLLRSNPVCARVLAEAERHELQILYTQIDRDADNQPRFTRHEYRVDPAACFYPASAIKLAGALLALEKLHQLGLSRDEAVRIDSAYSGQTPVREDSTAPGGRPTVAHYIRKQPALRVRRPAAHERGPVGEGIPRRAADPPARGAPLIDAEPSHQSLHHLPRRSGPPPARSGASTWRPATTPSSAAPCPCCPGSARIRDTTRRPGTTATPSSSSSVDSKAPMPEESLSASPADRASSRLRTSP